jgi:preprotein translocase SecE subunit
MEITEYVKDTRIEMNHVVWPTRAETIRFTTLVIAVSLGTSIILAVSDFVFGRLLTLLF